MFRLNRGIQCFCFLMCWMCPVVAFGETAYRVERGQWESIDCRTVAELPHFMSGNVKLSKYGGLASGRKFAAGGFFGLTRAEGRWTLVDPEGCPFVSVGICSVSLKPFSKSAFATEFDSEEAWAEKTGKVLQDHGFNTLGRWSDWEKFRRLAKPIAYTTTLSIMAEYDHQRTESNGARGFPRLTIPVFDREFPDFCEEYCRRVEKTRDDPWLLGHFSDNELPFRPDALDNYLLLPDSDPGHRTAAEWLAARRKGREQIADDDRAAFLETVAARYFRTVSAVLKRHDPHHLYLGSRLNGRNINDSTLRASRCVDVVSIQMYHQWSADQERIGRWAALSGRPFINSEWYAMSFADPGLEIQGAGFRVRTDRDRGLFYQNLCLGMLANPNCVGWHWFKYGGDDAVCHHGLVDEKFQLHAPMADLMRQLNTQAYQLREFLLPVNSRK
jgi:hypothetical protein